MNKLKAFFRDFSGKTGNKNTRILLLFGIEGLLFQYVMAMAGVEGYGTTLFASNLGATDQQIGMIQLVINLFALVFLLPVGILSDRMKNAKTMPMILMSFIGVMYFFYGSVPMMGQARMTFYFIFLALTTGVLVVYNAIWQAFFGDLTPMNERNRVYGFRNRFVFVIGTIAPMICGAILTAMPDSESKLSVLRVFFYLCGVSSLLNVYVLWKMPGGERTAEQLSATPKFSLKELSSVFGTLMHDKNFLIYLGCILFFYMGWYLDWGMWFIGQTQYVGLTEVHMSSIRAGISLVQLLALGFFVKLNEKKGVQFTFIFCAMSLALCPMNMLLNPLVPKAIGPEVFVIVNILVCIPQCASQLCLVQMLLQVTPEKNRSLIVSLNMAFITLANAILPSLGVEIYRAFGSNFGGYIGFNAICAAWRFAAMGLFIWRYCYNKKRGLLK